MELTVQYGFEGLSMRRLADRLGVAAKTIYNYFENKDELYLHILIAGFDRLHERLKRAAEGRDTPLDRLRGVISTYIDFGLENSGMYYLMFTWHVPKFSDYVGTAMEPVAEQELTAALRCADLFKGVIRECFGAESAATDDGVAAELAMLWASLHGYVAGINNTLIDYIHEDPLSLRDRVVERIVRNSERAYRTSQD